MDHVDNISSFRDDTAMTQFLVVTESSPDVRQTYQVRNVEVGVP